MRWLRYITMLCSFITLTEARIEKVTSYKEIKDIIDTVLKIHQPKDVLGLWEIDQVIFYSQNPAFHHKNIQKHGHKLKEKLKPLSQEIRDLAITLITYAQNKLLIEPHIPDFIKSYQAKGMPILALITAVPKYINYEPLKQYDIDFSKAFSDLKDHEIHGLRLKPNNAPMYKKGIICASAFGGMVVKGATLVAFLKTQKIHPSAIIMIDYKNANLDDIEIELKKYNPEIIFIGIEYDNRHQIATAEISEENFLQEWQPYLEKAKQLDSVNKNY